MTRDFISISREEAILLLAYAAAVFSFYAYKSAESAEGQAFGAQARVTALEAELAEHRDAVEDQEDPDDG